jgi:hypothetical protein
MFSPISRRRFVTGSAAAGAMTALGDFGFLGALPAAEERKDKSPFVRLADDIEPLVRLIEDTPREKLLEAVAARVRTGTSYEQLLSAVMLAGVRGIKPRPVGFQFHAVLVVNSAHLASLAAADQDRWLPLFWALDNFKGSQATNAAQNAGWKMPALDESKVPSADAARKAFAEAMDNWDEEAADVAVAALARTAGANEVFELFCRYGCRDFRDIGHKAIYVANSWRTLNAIGWRHAEPVLRSLAFALLDHRNEENPAKRDADADRPGRENLKRLADIGPLSRPGRKRSADATTDLLAALRTANAAEASGMAAHFLKGAVDPASVWDAIFLAAGELLMRQPGIVGIHCLTSANALHYAYQASGDDDTRKLVTLQGAAFMPLFRQAMTGRGKLSDLRIDTLAKAETMKAGKEGVEDVFADLSKTVQKTQVAAARKALALVEADRSQAEPLIAAARRLIFSKGRDSHDYKFSSAVLEDYYNVSPWWRPNFLASGLFNLPGAADRDNNLIQRTRDALARG